MKYVLFDNYEVKVVAECKGQSLEEAQSVFFDEMGIVEDNYLLIYDETETLPTTSSFHYQSHCYYAN